MRFAEAALDLVVAPRLLAAAVDRLVLPDRKASRLAAACAGPRPPVLAPDLEERAAEAAAALLTLGLAASLLLAAADVPPVLEPVRTPDLDDLAVEAALDLLTLGLAASRLLAAAALDLALAADLALLEAAPLFAREVDLFLDLELVLPLGGIIKSLRP